jgi:transposase
MGRKKSRRIPNTEQRALPMEVGEMEIIQPSQKSATLEHFTKVCSDGIFIGDQLLKEYLSDNGFEWVIRLGEMLKELDYTEFYSSYEGGGRKAIHPRAIIGLILYGLIEGKSSLRGLEGLSKVNVGAWWLTGGICPDHSTIGKFINQHKEEMEGGFFVELTGNIVRKLKLKRGEVAGDGTVIKAVTSGYRMLSKEAAELFAKEAEEKAKKHPENKKLEREAEIAVKAVKEANNREAERKSKGRETPVKISVKEPDAVYQPLKNGQKAPSYKPSVLCNEERLIVGKHVHPSKETASIAPMLTEYEAIYETYPQTALLDAGYHSGEMLEYFVQREIDVLCPSGKADKTGNFQRASRSEKLIKNDFKYVEEKDCYRCPLGKELKNVGGGKDRKGREYRRYRADAEACRACEFRPRCTTSQSGRQIKRYDKEVYKEAMAEVLKNPKAREKYRKRKSMVEPVFAELRERFGLNRFRRRGLQGVSIEFSLYCLAYNLKKALSLGLIMAKVSAQIQDAKGSKVEIGNMFFICWFLF